MSETLLEIFPSFLKVRTSQNLKFRKFRAKPCLCPRVTMNSDKVGKGGHDSVIHQVPKIIDCGCIRKNNVFPRMVLNSYNLFRLIKAIIINRGIKTRPDLHSENTIRYFLIQLQQIQKVTKFYINLNRFMYHIFFVFISIIFD